MKRKKKVKRFPFHSGNAKARLYRLANSTIKNNVGKPWEEVKNILRSVLPHDTPNSYYRIIVNEDVGITNGYAHKKDDNASLSPGSYFVHPETGNLEVTFLKEVSRKKKVHKVEYKGDLYFNMYSGSYREKKLAWYKVEFLEEEFIPKVTSERYSSPDGDTYTTLWEDTLILDRLSCVINTVRVNCYGHRGVLRKIKKCQVGTKLSKILDKLSHSKVKVFKPSHSGANN